jgi:hypothetical protein
MNGSSLVDEKETRLVRPSVMQDGMIKIDKFEKATQKARQTAEKTAKTPYITRFCCSSPPPDGP